MPFLPRACLIALLLSPAVAPAAPRPAKIMSQSKEAATLKSKLLEKHGPELKPRIERGVDQVAALWRKEDGDLVAFGLEHFIADPSTLDAVFERYETVFEQLEGHFYEISRALRWASDVDVGPLLPLDPLLASYEPAAHVTDDLFKNKLAFVALLNFPQSTLAEKLAQGKDYSRRRWAEVRLTGRFSRRVPAEILQEISEAGAAADLYVSQYNVWMHHVLDGQGQRLFPKGLRLISHWNLRDELKAGYADPRGLEKQRLIVEVMERIVTQTIPAAVIDDPRLDWKPSSNEVAVAPAGSVEESAPSRAAKPERRPEPDVRYARLWANYIAAKKADPYSPVAPTAIASAFELGAEMSEERVKALLTEVLESPLVPKVAAEIERRLGRRLEPQDLWYNGFVPRGAIPEAELDALCRKRYPDAGAFARDIPRILEQLGFSKERARYLAERIQVDGSRGAGHAMPAKRRGDFPRLRTRIENEGMSFKGYNIAIHELGHNVEQVFSLYDVDHTLLAGVPNTAFTEAVAFVFQARDLELLGLTRPDPEQERLKVLNTFWQTWEIAGVALVDIAVWHWMYENPKATPAQLREATVRISREVWNRHYAPVLGGKDSVLLGVYSHMVSYPLYLFNYPLGHLIAFQLEEQLERAGRIGPEIERMTKLGAVVPDLWMEHATGAPVSAAPLLRATERALSK